MTEVEQSDTASQEKGTQASIDSLPTGQNANFAEQLRQSTLAIVNAIQNGNEKLLRAVRDNSRDVRHMNASLKSVLTELQTVSRHVAAIRRNPPSFRRSRSPAERENHLKSTVKKVKK